MKKLPVSPQALQAFVLALATLGLLSSPQESSAAVSQGLKLCGEVILPALFPFFILSSLVLNLGLCYPLASSLGKIMPPLFHLSPHCATALLLGFVGGYPVGAKTTLALYEESLCNKDQAERLLAFVSNAGPAFILNVIGWGIFSSGKVAFLLYLAHFLGCIATGLLFRPKSPPVSWSLPKKRPPAPPFLPTFLQAVTSALESSLQICSFILCFSVIIKLLELSPLLTLVTSFLAPEYSLPLLMGMVELSTGVNALSLTSDPKVQLILMSFLLGWAGISIHCQVLALALGSGLSMKYYLWGNLCQGLCSAVFLWAVLYLSQTAILVLAVALVIIFFLHPQKKTRKKLSSGV